MTTKRFYYPIFGIIIFLGLFGWIVPSKAARTWTEFFRQLGGSNNSTTNNNTANSSTINNNTTNNSTKSSNRRGGGRERPVQAPTLAEETLHFGKELKMAVVVGINDYPSSSGLRSLRYAKADAEALAQALKQAGYGVQLLTNSNATKGSILNTLSNIGKVLEPQKGTAIFAFAGHGFRDRNGNNYLAPFEASAGYIEDTGLSLKKVEATLVASGARRRILLIDACRNDPKPGSRSGATVMDTFTQQPLFQNADGTRILFSTRAGGFSWENPELGHGIFTYFILEGLKGKAANKQGLITFRGLSDYVQKAVPKWAIEKGYAQRPYDAGEGSGWFLVSKIEKNHIPSQLPLEQHLLEGCVVDKLTDSWEPTDEQIDTLLAVSNGGWCNDPDANSDFTIPSLRKAVQDCSRLVGSKTVDLTIKKPNCNDSCTCRLVINTYEVKGRQFLRLFTTPVADYKIQVYEFIGTKIIPYYSGFPYFNGHCMEGMDMNSDDEVSVKMQSEWSQLPPNLQNFICWGKIDV
ncbi:hypothetical protein TI05_01180 [Achromatium sp. WMS3]|nr:hypothetical protein TI05_01180 [Achromatium sp. WMS3]